MKNSYFRERKYALIIILAFFSISGTFKNQEKLIFRFRYMYYACGLCFTQYQVTAIIKGKGYKHLIGKDMFMKFYPSSLEKIKTKYELSCIRCYHYNCEGFLTKNKKNEYTFHTKKIIPYAVEIKRIKEINKKKKKQF